MRSLPCGHRPSEASPSISNPNPPIRPCLPMALSSERLTFGDSSFKTDKVAGENKEVGKWVDKYLGVGEWVMDQSVAIAGSSGWFDRTR